MPIAILDHRLRFPDPRDADAEGLVAVEGGKIRYDGPFDSAPLAALRIGDWSQKSEGRSR